MTQKILEYKNLDWMKGITAQPNAAVGGLFQQFSGCDPFELQGIAMPSLTGNTISPATTPKFLTSYSDTSPQGYVLAHSNSKLYQILKDSPYSIVDKTSSITVSGNLLNAIVWQGNYVYAQNDLRAVVLPGFTGDVQIFTASFSEYPEYRAMCIGADGNLYIGDTPYVRTITNVASTSGNSTTCQIDLGYHVRALVNDGRYLVIIADNNQQLISKLQVGDYQCRIYFWDMVTKANGYGVWDVMYEISDSYITAAAFMEGGIYLFGRNGLYICNSATQPKMIRPFVGTNYLVNGSPLNSEQVSVSKGSIFWIDGSATTLKQGIVNAYGNPVTGKQKIFYQPFVNGGQSIQTALAIVGDQFWVVNSFPIIYVQNIGTARNQMQIRTLDTNMVAPHKFMYTKVVLSQPLASGQSIQHVAYGAGGATTVSGGETQSYSALKPKQTLLFRRTGANATDEKFEDISVSLTCNGGVAIQRVAVYADPLDDSNVDL